MSAKTSATVRFRACVHHAPNRADYPPPPGYEWIPGYLAEHGDRLNGYGRAWLTAKREEPYRAAVEDAEREYMDCLRGGPPESQPAQPAAMRLTVASRLGDTAARHSATTAAGPASPMARLNVDFRETPPPPPPRAPKSVFWTGIATHFDADALNAAMKPLNPGGIETGFNNQPANPRSIRDLMLLPADVAASVRIGGHEFLPFPAGVEIDDDLRTEIIPDTMRLDIILQWAADGSIAAAWSAAGSATGAALVDFMRYFWPGYPDRAEFDWNTIPDHCIAELVARATPSAMASVLVFPGEAGAAPLETIILSISTSGALDGYPVVGRHILHNNTAFAISAERNGPSFVFPGRAATLDAPGKTAEFADLPWPECLAGLAAYRTPGDQWPPLRVELTPTGGLRVIASEYFHHVDWPLRIHYGVPGGLDRHLAVESPYIAIDLDIAGVEASWPTSADQAQVVVARWNVTRINETTWRHYAELRLDNPPVPCGGQARTDIDGLRIAWPDGVVTTSPVASRDIAGRVFVFRNFHLPTAAKWSLTAEVTLAWDYLLNGNFIHNQRRQPDGSIIDVPTPRVSFTRTVTP